MSQIAPVISNINPNRSMLSRYITKIKMPSMKFYFFSHWGKNVDHKIFLFHAQPRNLAKKQKIYTYTSVDGFFFCYY